MLLKRNKPASEQKIARDFRLRSPFGNYRPVDYESYKPFIEFKPVIDGYLDKLFATGTALDEGCKDAIDPLIADMAAKAEQHLARQRIEHANEIQGLSSRRSGDQRAFGQQLETLKEALVQNECELDAISRRCHISKF